MKVVSFTPIKMNNERVPGKNTKCFGDGTPLIKMILSTLESSEFISESYVFCSNEEIKQYLNKETKFLKRDKKYDTADADVNDMFLSFAKQVPADIYVLAHATAPFLKVKTIDDCIRIVSEGDYDSAFAVKTLKEFLWSEGKPFNFDTLKIPRSQDLKPLALDTTGLYIFTDKVIRERKSRVGYNPYLYPVTDIEAVDINNPIDFEIANVIYMSKLYKKF